MVVLRGRITAARTAALALASVTMFSAMAAVPIPARAQAKEDAASASNGLVVQGSGQVEATPDIARISLGVETQGREASGVAQDNAKKTDALIQAVRAAGVAERDIRTSDYNISPQYDYSGQKNGKPPTIVGYQATNMVNVTVRNIASVGKVIDAAVQAGGNAANGISFDLSEESKAAAETEALTKAMADAKRKASALAKAAGASNLMLVKIQEETAAPPIIRPMFARAMTADAAPSTPIQAGQQTVTANVTARYLFAPVPLQ